MALGWNPFQEMERLRRELDYAFGGGRGSWNFPFSRASFIPGRAARAYPLLNLSEDAEAYYIEALAPGIDPDKTQVTVKNDTLEIAGEKQAEPREVRFEDYHRNERAASRFVRSLTLPSHVKVDAIKAEYRDGLLRLTLPKAEEARPRQITVSVA